MKPICRTLILLRTIPTHRCPPSHPKKRGPSLMRNSSEGISSIPFGWERTEPLAMKQTGLRLFGGLFETRLSGGHLPRIDSSSCRSWICYRAVTNLRPRKWHKNNWATLLLGEHLDRSAFRINVTNNSSINLECSGGQTARCFQL